MVAIYRSRAVRPDRTRDRLRSAIGGVMCRAYLAPPAPDITGCHVTPRAMGTVGTMVDRMSENPGY